MFIQEHAFQTVVCEMASILSRPQRVNYVLSCTASSLSLPRSALLSIIAMNNIQLKHCVSCTICVNGWRAILNNERGVSFVRMDTVINCMRAVQYKIFP